MLYTLKFTKEKANTFIVHIWIFIALNIDDDTACIEFIETH